jgi:hypothetical protein
MPSTWVSYEIQLMAIAVLLYLHDTTLLLYANEGLLIAGRNNSWSAGVGQDGLRFQGRAVVLLAPLGFWRPTYRLSWQFDAAPAKVNVATQLAPPKESTSLSLFVINAGIALFGLLPVGLFAHLGVRFIATVLVMLYLNVVLALVMVYVHRQAFQLGTRKFWSLCFECLACPPFAVNLVRRLTLAQTVAEPFTAAAQRLLSKEAWHAIEAQCAERLDQAIEAEPAGSPRAQALHAQRQQFNTEQAQ